MGAYWSCCCCWGTSGIISTSLGVLTGSSATSSTGMVMPSYTTHTHTHRERKRKG
jgi:hypothetical protein